MFCFSCVCVRERGSLTSLLLSPDVDIKYVGGADPEMVFLDVDGGETEVISCTQMSSVACITLSMSAYK